MRDPRTGEAWTRIALGRGSGGPQCLDSQAAGLRLTRLVVIRLASADDGRHNTGLAKINDG